jgi:tetratricopeptide (TPR) repeat protein
VSERERFHIDGFYYEEVTGDQQKAIEMLELACQTYPQEKGFYINLALAQANVGRIEDALGNAQKALALSPDSALSNINVMFDLMELDRFPEALTVAAEVKKLGMNDTADMANLYTLHAFTGDRTAMAQDAAIVQGRDDEYLMTITEAQMDEYFGQYAAADRAWKLASEQCDQNKAKDAEASAMLWRLTGRTLAGLKEEAAPILKDALALDQTKPTLETAMSGAALFAQPAIAQPIMDKLAHDWPDDTVINQIWLPCSRAWLDLNAHQPQAALHDLDGTEPYDLVAPSEYIRGLADLELHDGANAIAAFQKATRYRGATVINLCQDYPQAQLGLARAYAMTGDTASAKEAYEALFVTWKDADADLPQLVAAKKEYAALK